MAGPDSEQGCQRRKNHWNREEESAKPGCYGIPHGGHHTVKQQDLLGKPVSAPTQATALLCVGNQGHGPLLGSAGLPPAHPRRSLGGSRRREVRAKAQRMGTGESELQSSGKRIQTGSHHSSELSSD